MALVEILTFYMRVSLDEFFKFCLPASGCLHINDTTNNDRTFAFDHINLFRGQPIQIRKVDLGNELLNSINRG